MKQALHRRGLIQDTGHRIHERGFSIIEILVAIAIIVILATIAFLALGQFRSRSDVDRAASGTLAFLRLARERTVAGDSDVEWGVHVTSSQVMLFQGSSYTAAEDTLTLPSGVTASAVLTGGGSDIVFERIEGSTLTNGTITLSGSGSSSRIVTIYVSGEAGVAQTLPAPQDTRVIDSRHAHLALPFSLSGSNTMTLTFSDAPNPDVTGVIDIPANTSSGQFFWEGVVDVNGSDQHLALVTHAIGVSTTDLSVQRDRMENAKSLSIDIDGVVIATYTAGGVLTGGVGVIVDLQ